MTTKRRKHKTPAGPVCQKCGRADEVHLHHIIALQAGGVDDPSNLIPLCVVCHTEWHQIAEATTRIEWAQWLELPPASYLAVAFLQPWPEDMTGSEMKSALMQAWKAYRMMRGTEPRITTSRRQPQRDPHQIGPHNDPDAFRIITPEESERIRAEFYATEGQKPPGE